MKTQLLTIAALTAALSITACQHSIVADPTDMEPGTYKKTSRSVDSNGTEWEKVTITTVEEDRYGNRTATVETKTTKDPEGLLNKKTTSKTKKVVEEKKKKY